MKITFILFLACCLFTGKSVQAQTEFAPIGAEWYYGSTGIYHDVHYSHLWVENDTVIDGIQCRKISGTLMLANRDSSNMDPLYVYNNDDTIFYYNRSFLKFTPLFIFNVDQGDTITYYLPYYRYSSFHYYTPPTRPDDSLFQVKVDSIEIISINGQNLKRVWTSAVNSSINNWNLNGSYTEKIGSAFLPVPHYPRGGLPHTYEKSLRCYKDALISYQYTDYTCDYMYLGINEFNDLPTSISIHPNPNRGVFKLRIDLERSSEMTGVMTDITGRQVSLFHIPSGIKEQEYQLNLSPGLYLLRLSTANGFYSQKLVIQ